MCSAYFSLEMYSKLVIMHSVQLFYDVLVPGAVSGSKKAAKALHIAAVFAL